VHIFDVTGQIPHKHFFFVQDAFNENGYKHRKQKQCPPRSERKWRADEKKQGGKVHYAGARKELWIPRDKGVHLRNEGKTTGAFDSWTEKYVAWHSEVLKQASVLSMDLRHSFEPVDKIRPESVEAVALPIKQHEINVSVMSEMISRLYEYLNRTAEPH
jgi:hypothetical protein